MITISIRTGTVVIVGVGRKAASLLDKAGDVVLPVEIFGSLGRWKIKSKRETIGATIGLVEEFIWNDEIATGEGVVGKGAVPNAKAGDVVGRTIGGLAGKTFMVTFTFENSTITKDDAGADDGVVGEIVVLRSISPDEWGEIGSSKDLVWVLVVVITLFDGWGKGVVVENVGRGNGGKEDGRHNRNGVVHGWSSSWWRFGKWNGIDVIEIEAIEVVGKV